MYIVLVEPPGRCGKGTALSIGYEFLEKTGIEMSAQTCTKEALIVRLKKSEQQDPLTGDHHSSLTIYSPDIVLNLLNF